MDLDYRSIDPSTPADRDRLFALIGPLFANRRVRREMPYMHHEDDFFWTVAVSPDGDVVAMGSVDIRSCCATLRNLYVIPSWRRLGVGGAITDLQIEHARARGARWVRSVASPLSLSTYERRGFYRVASRGQYVTMEFPL